MDVAEWLRGLGLEQYVPVFPDIDEEVLRLLTGEDLRELGVASIGHRRRLLDSIVTLDAGRSVTGAHPCVGCISKAEQRQLTVSGSARKGLDI
jgi:SAM domain (Sterile alpha motif)